MSTPVHYAAAGYAALAIETGEEERLIAAILAGVANPPGITRSAVLLASATQSVNLITGERLAQPGFPAAIQMAASQESTILVILDWQHVIRNAGAYRALRDALPMLRAQGSMVIMVAPSWALPAELEREVPVIKWALPTRDELRAAMINVAESAGLDSSMITPTILDSAAGLPLSQAEGVAALAYAETGTLAPEIIRREKMASIRNTGYMAYWEPVPLSDLGGLGQFKSFLRDEVIPSWHNPLLRVKGILLTGLSGTGKSEAARCVSDALGIPAIQLKISECKDSKLGETERRFADALARVEALAPCALVIDEVEKGVGGYASSAQTDGGTMLGVVGMLLTWLNDHKSQVITIATCNDYAALPPELTRAGRFSAAFFVDLATESERVEIAQVHLRKLDISEDHAEQIAQLTDGFTGAEIKELILSAARRAQKNGGQVSAQLLAEAAADAKPISRTQAAKIQGMRDAARDVFRVANSIAVPAAPRAARQLSRAN